MSRQPASSRWRPDFRGLPRPFWVLFAGTLINRAGGFVLVFIAIYLTEVRGLSAAEAGLVVSAYGVGAIAGGPVGGVLSDRVGRRPTLAWSLLMGGAAMAALGATTEVPVLVATAAITGLFYEMYRPVVSAIVADLVRPDDRPRAYSLIYWAVNVGASAAPLVGGLIAARSYPLLFVVDGATTAAYGVLAWLALPETRPADAPRGSSAGGAARAVVRDRLFMAICVLVFPVHLVFFQGFIGLPLDMRAHGVSTSTFAILMAINPVLVVALQPWAGEFVRGRSRASMLALASWLLGAGFGMNAWIESPAGYAAAIAVFTLGEILIAPAAISLVADLAPPELRGRYQGTFAMAVTGAFAAAPIAGGAVMAAFGAAWLWVLCFATGTAAAGGFLLLRGVEGRRALAPAPSQASSATGASSGGSRP